MTTLKWSSLTNRVCTTTHFGILPFLLANFLCFSPEIAYLQAEDQPPLSSEAMIVVGAGGAGEYLDAFQKSADGWRLAFPENVKTTMIGGRAESSKAESTNSTDDRQLILDWIQKEPKSAPTERWLILLGHGTYQLKMAKFNLEGPDLSAEDLAKAIGTSPTQWRIFVCASCSAPFINALSGPNRIIVTATKSGSELNLSRFGDYFSQSISDTTSDLDHDGNVSILEAFIMASQSLSNWYSDEGRLASEQALIDDNGDNRGTPAAFFRGVRAAKAPANGLKVDGALANRVYVKTSSEHTTLTPDVQSQTAELERRIETLRERKKEIDEEMYYAQLEESLVELAKLLAPSSIDSTSPKAP